MTPGYARPLEARASRTPSPHNSDWPLVLVERVFDEAFGASACADAEAPQQASPVDVVAYSPDGLRMSFSVRTAEWLTAVTETPHDFGLVHDFLVEALGTSSHPLGRLMGTFVSAMEASFGASSADSQAVAVDGAAEGRICLSARCLRLAVGRTHDVVGTVLPPLQRCAPPPSRWCDPSPHSGITPPLGGHGAPAAAQAAPHGVKRTVLVGPRPAATGSSGCI